MSRLPFLFDAVLFDLDGTLVATDRFWVEAAREGARRAFAELEIEREMPTREQWMNLVGMPLALGFDQLFADLTPRERRVVYARCVEEENRALKAGQAALLPGVETTLADLRSRGVRVGLASNCGQDYLDAMMNGLGLARFVEQARCLDTPRMQSKGGMVGDLLETFGTRAAVMVGDRLGDRDAAWENGVPHVHLARGFAQPGEDVPCEAVIEGIGDLLPRLEKRAQWIADALDRLGFASRISADESSASLNPTMPSSSSPAEASSNAASIRAPRTLGITGHSGSGKTIFARDAAMILRSRGHAAAVVALDDFLKLESQAVDLTSTAFVPKDRALDHLSQAFEVEELVQRVLEPHAHGEAIAFERGTARIEVPAGAVLLLQGLFLLHPALRPKLERVVHLEVSESQSLRRVAGRDARKHGPESLLRVRRHFLPTQRAFDDHIDPKKSADLVLDAENALGPA
jgi:phosphoglycolate phosphatase-like HAD superfamily hydrolase/uridine kinase